MVRGLFRKVKLEDQLVGATQKTCKLLWEMKLRGKVTETVYNTEIQKRINLLNSLNESYSQVLATKE